MHLEIAVCLPIEGETVGLARAAVTNTLRLFGVTDDCVEDIRLAVSEACTNVIQHAASDDDYEVQIEVDDDRCVISIKNVGDDFDAAALAGTMPDPNSARGRGVAIMRTLMDSVEFASEPSAGTLVRVVKVLSVHEDSPLRRLRRRSPPPETPR